MPRSITCTLLRNIDSFFLYIIYIYYIYNKVFFEPILHHSHWGTCSSNTLCCLIPARRKYLIQFHFSSPRRLIPTRRKYLIQFHSSSPRRLILARRKYLIHFHSCTVAAYRICRCRRNLLRICCHKNYDSYGRRRTDM